jgi:YggT family protein
VTIFWQVIYQLLFFFFLILLARVVIELIKAFARDWRPTGAVVIVLEVIFSITDPPVKFLRKLIPPIPLGAVRLDLSILILLIGVTILQRVVLGIIHSSGTV